MRTLLFYILLTLFLTGCATYRQPNLISSTPLDMTHSKNEAENYWVAAKFVAPKYPRSLAKAKITGCSRFKISITSEGKTINAELLETYPTDAFIETSMNVINKWTWKPTPENKARLEITRMVQMDFYMPDAINYEQAKRHCTVGTQF
ncbi:MAG: protein TonB [Paraglaciecola sp.]|jgi:protein TonB